MKKIVHYIMCFVMAAGIFFNTGLTSRAADGTESGSNFTNLIVFAKFSGEEEFVDTVYGGSSVRKIILADECPGHFS